MANLLGEAMKAKKKMKQMTKQAAAARLKPAKINSRSHRLTAEKVSGGAGQ